MTSRAIETPSVALGPDRAGHGPRPNAGWPLHGRNEVHLRDLHPSAAGYWRSCVIR
ncbi:hypothetical protein OHU74_00390 [Streptomyces sp. NBC_00454]